MNKLLDKKMYIEHSTPDPIIDVLPLQVIDDFVKLFFTRDKCIVIVILPPPQIQFS